MTGRVITVGAVNVDLVIRGKQLPNEFLDVALGAGERLHHRTPIEGFGPRRRENWGDVPHRPRDPRPKRLAHYDCFAGQSLGQFSKIHPLDHRRKNLHARRADLIRQIQKL